MTVSNICWSDFYAECGGDPARATPHLTAAPPQTPGEALALGLAKSYGGLPPLAGVEAELDAVVHDPAVPSSHGPLAGRLLLDEQFTLPAFEQQLRQNYALIHIASHFVMTSAQGAEPYLLLSGGPLTLSGLEDSTINFSWIRLLTLSACSSRNGWPGSGAAARSTR